jgi:hypothetical protein
MGYPLLLPAGENRVCRFRRRSKLRCFVIALVGAAVVGIASATTVPNSLADDRVEASYNAGNELVRDPELDQLLARLGRRIQAANSDAACASLRIHALDQPLPYAFVLKNGAFYLSTGLIARIQSESEFAALISLPLAALCRGDADKLSSDQRRRTLTNLVPNLLLVTLTAGLGASSIAKTNAHNTTEEREQLRDASDAIALRWLATAEFDPKAAPLAMTHLIEGLAAEGRTGAPEFSNPDELASRRAALEKAVALTGSLSSAPSTTAAAKDPYRLLSRRFALKLARTDIDSHAMGVASWLDYLDALDGPVGYTAYLRAESARRNSGEDEGVATAIAAYEKCVSFADAPAPAYRELGFLYRRAGDLVRARAALTTYLQKAPAAVDAAIIRTYLEVP